MSQKSSVPVRRERGSKPDPASTACLRGHNSDLRLGHVVLPSCPPDVANNPQAVSFVSQVLKRENHHNRLRVFSYRAAARCHEYVMFAAAC
jgi:hypothetical protein